MLFILYRTEKTKNISALAISGGNIINIFRGKSVKGIFSGEVVGQNVMRYTNRFLPSYALHSPFFLSIPHYWGGGRG